MTATLIRCVLYAVLAGGIAFDLAIAADAGSIGSSGAPTVSEAAAESGTTADASSNGNVKRLGAPSKGGAANRSGQPATAPARSAAHLPRHGAGALVGTQASAAKPTVGAIFGRRSGKPDQSHSVAHSGAAGPAPVLNAGPASVAASHAIAGSSFAPSHPTPVLKAAAAAAFIGGPRAPGGATVGGPANTRSVTILKASIDATALRRRF
jgi:hypothetical protein